MADSISTACAASAIKNKYIVHWEDGSFTVETGDSDEDFRNKFVNPKLSIIRYVDRDFRIQIKNDLTSSSNLELQQKALSTWAPEKIQAPALWQQGYTGQGVRVGVVDGMIDQTHPQLQGRIRIHRQFNSQTNDPLLNKHGTHVTGIIAADPAFGSVQGVAQRAEIIAAQFLDNNGGGSLGEAILAMNFAVDEGAQILNLSWGGAPCAENLKSAMEQINSKNVLIVTAAGNESTNSDSSPTYPAAYNFLNQLNVAASTVDDFLAAFSNRGARTVHIAAPGVDILSLIPLSKVENMSGTSMAAPIVSGVAALLLSAEPTATAQQVKQAVLYSADSNSSLFQVSSRGRINAHKALERLRLILSSN